jgi:hypothetical protein
MQDCRNVLRTEEHGEEAEGLPLAVDEFDRQVPLQNIQIGWHGMRQ